MHTVYLKEALQKLERDAMLSERAEILLKEWEHEALLASLYATPQTPPHHAEGPTVRAHLHRMLVGLFAIVEGKLSVLEIEEFARMKGYEDELHEMEETIKEHAATFEVFTLLHDIGKQFCASLDEFGRVHYLGHEKEIHRPEVRELLLRMATRYRLSDEDVDYLVPLISFHLEPMRRLGHGHDPKHVRVLDAIATKHGLDADDFIDLLQAAVFLDQVVGSAPSQADPLIRFFLAEAEYAPWKRAQKEEQKARQRKAEAMRVFHTVGLDGEGVMKLTGMRPSKDLGALLQAVQSAARGEGEIDKRWPSELQRRVREAQESLSR